MNSFFNNQLTQFILVSLQLLFWFDFGVAQPVLGGNPKSFELQLRQSGQQIQSLNITGYDGRILMAENRQTDIMWQSKFGQDIPQEIDVLTAGSKMTLPDGSVITRLEIIAEGATSVRSKMDQFLLAPGVQVYIYADGEFSNEILGPYTSIHNKVNGTRGSSIIN